MQNRINRCVCLLALVVLSCVRSPAQDLFDIGHSRAYAAHLMRSRQYSLAAEEYERLHFMQPANDTFRVQLLRAYRLGQQPERGIEAWKIWDSRDTSANWGFRLRPENAEYANLLLFSRRHQEALSFARSPNTLNVSQQRRTLLFGHLLEQDWTQADAIMRDWPAQTPLPYRNEFGQLIRQGQQLHLKKPWVAASLSTVVPGLGKVYTGNWKDGLISAMFVGLNGWQAWRRFDKEGSSSVWGWIHAGFGMGFYIGNIYGSHKAARLYNQTKKIRLRNETERLIYPALD